MAKSTNAQIELRIATVAEMIIKGQSRQDIIQHSADNWDIGVRQTDEYISKAYDKIKEQTDDLVKNQARIAIGRLNDLYKRSYNIQDYRECRQVQADIIKLLELQGTLTVEMADQDNKPVMRSVKNF